MSRCFAAGKNRNVCSGDPVSLEGADIGGLFSTFIFLVESLKVYVNLR